MTVNEIYTYIGQKLFDSIPEELEGWEKAVMHCKRLDRFFTGGGKLFIDGSKEIRLDKFEAGWEMSRYIHQLYEITTEGNTNRWNRLEFTLFSNFQFDLQFVWDQELQDEVDGFNSEI